MALALRAAFFALLLVFSAFPANAGRLQSVKVTESSALPVIRPDWPIPQEPNQLFYLQRSSNSNTVVYTALFDAAGQLQAKRPAQVYWRRYNTTGERKALKPIEQRFAYGFNFKPGPESGTYIATLKPLPELPMTLRQTGPGQAELIGALGGRTVRVVYAYVSLDESGLIPKVTTLSVHGIDIATGKAISEVFSVSGGVITQ